MKADNILLFTTVVLMLLFGCTNHQDTVITLDMVKSNPAKLLVNHEFRSDSALVDRVKPIPDQLLSLLMRSDGIDTYSAYMPTIDEISMIERYISQLPPLIKKVLDDYLVGIYFVNDFLGSGMADFMLGENDKVFIYAVFNPETLKTKISEWVTYRESTCINFDDDSTIQIYINCGDKYTGFMYALLHESTHLLDYIMQITPYVHVYMKMLGLVSEHDSTDFTSTVWRTYNKPRTCFNYGFRKDVTFYGIVQKPKIEYSRALSIYRVLSHSPFVSLYASMNWAEDLAEFVTWYHFTKDLAGTL